MTIPSREDHLDELKAAYSAQLQSVVSVLRQGRPADPQSLCNRFHLNGVSYFNAFERTVDEYSLPEFQISQDVINRKGEDALNFVDTIIGHWTVLRAFCTKYGLQAPIPSATAYASLQRVIKKFYPEMADANASKFRQASLPVHGFEHKTKHSGWKMKRNVTTQLVVGTAFLIFGYILAHFSKHPTGIQYLFMRGFFALGFVSVAVGVLVGTVNLKWSVTKSLLITASGGFALLILIYYINPPPPPSTESSSVSEKMASPK